MKEITNAITWREINGNAASVLPDMETEVLIYDGYSDDSICGYLDVGQDGTTPIWLSAITGSPIPDPQFWADVPIPVAIFKVDLPAMGEVVDYDRLINIARSHGKQDILDYLVKHGRPEKQFSSDGCSMWPDSWLGHNIYSACFWHDVRYWCGVPGDDVARLYADAELARDVATLAGADLARAMFVGVGFGGTEDLSTPFRWGYGRRK